MREKESEFRFHRTQTELCSNELHCWSYDHHIEEFRCYYCGIHFGMYLLSSKKQNRNETLITDRSGLVTLDVKYQKESEDMDDYDFSGKHC